MKNILLFLPILALTSCAMVPWGGHEKVSVTSDPSGADVKLSTGEHGVTPAKFVKSGKDGDFTVTISKARYATLTVNVVNRHKTFTPNPVSVHLVPVPKGKTTPATRKTVTSTTTEKPKTKPKATVTPTPTPTPEEAPELQSTPEPINAPTPEATATPYVPPNLETSPTP